MPTWPDWWSWELELSAHLLKRMIDRQFNEADLRQMLQDASALTRNHEPGRWVIVTKHQSRSWEINVEPLPADGILLVVTAYPVD